MSRERKPFKETKFGQILGKVGQIIPDAAGIALKAATGNFGGAMQDLKTQLLDSAGVDGAQEALTELNLKWKEIELELSKVELEETKAFLIDRQDARAREVALAQVGKSDFMMVLSGCVALLMFVFSVVVVFFQSKIGIELNNNPIANQIVGLITGVAISVFSYYFGTSKSSKDKTKASILKG